MRQRWFTVFVCILAIGGILSSLTLIGGLVFWIVIGSIAVIAAGEAASRHYGRPFLSRIFKSGFLCDFCRYNDARYCRRPERPNARRCPDYKAR